MKLLTPKETALALHVSLPVVYRLCSMADFPAVRFGRAIRINEEDLAAWIRAHAGKDVLEEVR